MCACAWGRGGGCVQNMGKAVGLWSKSLSVLIPVLDCIVLISGVGKGVGAGVGGWQTVFCPPPQQY